VAQSPASPPHACSIKTRRGNQDQEAPKDESRDEDEARVRSRRTSLISLILSTYDARWNLDKILKNMRTKATGKVAAGTDLVSSSTVARRGLILMSLAVKGRERSSLPPGVLGDHHARIVSDHPHHSGGTSGSDIPTFALLTCAGEPHSLFEKTRGVQEVMHPALGFGALEVAHRLDPVVQLILAWMRSEAKMICISTRT
jgi:hypothetical protein